MHTLITTSALVVLITVVTTTHLPTALLLLALGFGLCWLSCATDTTSPR